MSDSKRILVVDDDAAIQTVIHEVLTYRGFHGDRAADGDQALRKLRAQNYDVLLLDLMLPKVNGFEVLRELRCVRVEVLKRTIVFTGVCDETLRYFDADQIFRLVRKPFDVRALDSALTDCIAKHARAHSQAEQPGYP